MSQHPWAGSGVRSWSMIPFWCPQTAPGGASSPGSPSCAPWVWFHLCWCFPRQHSFRALICQRSFPKAGQQTRQSSLGIKNGVNTVCALQLENKLWVLLFFTVCIRKKRINVWDLCLFLGYFWGSNRHLWASGWSAVAGHILAGNLWDFMALSSSLGISKLGCAGQSTEKVKSLTTQFWKRAEHPLGQLQLHLLF